MSSVYAGIDLFDLSRGQGEWRNLQDVVRKALRMSFENAQRQEETITKLEATVLTLQKELADKASLSDVKLIVDTKLAQQPRPASADDVTALRVQVSNIRSEMERKASVRYVDDSLKRKVNKSDVALERHGKSDTSVESCMQDVMSVKTKLLALERSIQGLGSQMEKYSTKSEVSSLAGSLQDICDLTSSKVDRSEMQSLLSLKLGINDADKMFRTKPDKLAVEKSLQSLENIMATHEREITSLVLHGGSDIRHFGSDRGSSSQKLAHGLVSASQPTGSILRAVSEKGDDGTDSEGDASGGIGRIGRLLVAGREEAHKLATSNLLESTSAKLELLQKKVDGTLEQRLRAQEAALQSQAEVIEAHESCIQKNSQDIRRIGDLEVALEATNVQVLELREQHGTPLTVPLSSVLIELEGRLSELDNIIQAEIVMNGENRANQEREDTNVQTGLQDRLLSIEQELYRVNRYGDEISDCRRDYEELRHSLLMYQAKLKISSGYNDEHAAASRTSIHHDAIPDDDWCLPYQRLRERVDKIEAFCTISGSRTIHTVQDVVNAVRLLRRSVLAAEDKINDVTQDLSNYKTMLQKEGGSFSRKDRENVKRRFRETDKRLESCEVVEQVHQVRLDAIEDSLNKIESRHRAQYGVVGCDEEKNQPEWGYTTMASNRAMGMMDSEDSISSADPMPSSRNRLSTSRARLGSSMSKEKQHQHIREDSSSSSADTQEHVSSTSHKVVGSMERSAGGGAGATTSKNYSPTVSASEEVKVETHRWFRSRDGA